MLSIARLCVGMSMRLFAILWFFIISDGFARDEVSNAVNTINAFLSVSQQIKGYAAPEYETVKKKSKSKKVRKRSSRIQNQKATDIPPIKRAQSFQNEISDIKVSDDGAYVAYIIEQNGYTNLILENVKKHERKSVTSKAHVKGFCFIESNLLYWTLKEENQFTLYFKKKDHQPTKLQVKEEINSIRVLGSNNRSALLECSSEDHYILLKFDFKNGQHSIKNVKEMDAPTNSFFNQELIPQLIIREVNGTKVAYVPKKKERKNAEEEVEIDQDEDNSDLDEIDRIDGDTSEEYISVDRANHLYKFVIFHKNGKTCLKIICIDFKNEEGKTVFTANGITEGQFEISVNKRGEPFMLSANGKSRTHYTWNSQVATSLRALNSLNWSLIDTTSNNNIWLLRKEDSQRPDKYMLFNRKNGKLVDVGWKNTTSISEKQSNFQSTNYYNIGVGEEIIQIYYTRSIGGGRGAPLVIWLNSDNSFSGRYSAFAQLLSNRGFNVVAVNCRKDRTKISEKSKEQDEESEEEDVAEDETEEEDNDLSKNARDIIKVVSWCLKQSVASGNNTLLIAENGICTDAMKVFLKSSKAFKGIAIISPTDDSLKKIKKLDYENSEQKRRMLFLLRPNQSVSDIFSSQDEVSIFTEKSETLPREKAAMIELYLKNLFPISRQAKTLKKGFMRLPRFESLSKEEDELFTKNRDDLELTDGESESSDEDGDSSVYSAL